MLLAMPTTDPMLGAGSSEDGLKKERDDCYIALGLGLTLCVCGMCVFVYVCVGRQ